MRHRLSRISRPRAWGATRSVFRLSCRKTADRLTLRALFPVLLFWEVAETERIIEVITQDEIGDNNHPQ